MAKTCEATRENGDACRAWARAGSTLCISHDPAARDELVTRSRVGGLKSAATRAAKFVTIAADVADQDLKSAAGLKVYLEAVLRALATQPQTTKLAHCQAQVAMTQRALITDAVEEELRALTKLTKEQWDSMTPAQLLHISNGGSIATLPKPEHVA